MLESSGTKIFIISPFYSSKLTLIYSPISRVYSYSYFNFRMNEQVWVHQTPIKYVYPNLSLLLGNVQTSAPKFPQE